MSPWRANLSLMLLGAVMVGLSFTWGPLGVWVWPLGVAIVVAALVNVKLQRDLSWLRMVVSGLLVALTLVRLLAIHQVRQVEHLMTWQLGQGTGASGEPVVRLAFVKHPEFALRVESVALAQALQARPQEAITAQFEVIYDLRRPRRYKLRRVAGQRVSERASQGALRVRSVEGGWRVEAPEGGAEASTWSSPWAWPGR